MLGTVLVTPVFLESTGEIDVSTENWTPALINQVKQTIKNGVEWWEETLTNFTSVHSLDFIFDFQYADNPVPTKYEPIARRSDDYELWVNEFLTYVGFNSPQSIDADIRQFNDAQRRAHGTDWAFTIFVVNSFADADGQFASGGSFSRAFAFAGGRYFVSPASRPESTFAHETGHMFWARDEYFGGSDWSDRRGYYNTQNVNAANNPTPGFVQQDSIMSSSTSMEAAFTNHWSAPSTLAMVGWQDSDGDGVFDVLDVPHELQGVGWYDADLGRYRFQGTAKVGTLPNRNSSGLQNDITTNRITRVEYRIDSGLWQTAQNYGTPTADIDIQITVPAGHHTIQIRTVTIDALTGKLVTSSPVFTGPTNGAAMTAVGGISGFVYHDANGNGQRDLREVGLAGATVQLVDAGGQPLELQKTIEPDDYDDAAVLNNRLSGVTLSATGSTVGSNQVVSRTANAASTGTRVLANFSTSGASRVSWLQGSSELRINFATPQTYIAIDALAHNSGAMGRLEAYDAFGNLLARYNTQALSGSAVETMVIARSQADIAFVKAFGRGGAVRLDNLRIGPATVTQTSTHGAYQFTALPPGTYHTIISPPVGAASITPATGEHVVTLTAGQSVSNAHFALQSAAPWSNPVNAADVDNDGRVSARDVIMLLKQLLTTGSGELPPPTDNSSPPEFWDVTGDDRLSVSDLRVVLTVLVLQPAGGEAPPSGDAEPLAESSNGESDEEGSGGESEAGRRAARIAAGDSGYALVAEEASNREERLRRRSEAAEPRVHDVALAALVTDWEFSLLRAHRAAPPQASDSHAADARRTARSQPERDRAPRPADRPELAALLRVPSMAANGSSPFERTARRVAGERDRELAELDEVPAGNAWAEPSDAERAEVPAAD